MGALEEEEGAANDGCGETTAAAKNPDRVRTKMFLARIPGWLTPRNNRRCSRLAANSRHLSVLVACWKSVCRAKHYPFDRTHARFDSLLFCKQGTATGPLRTLDVRIGLQFTRRVLRPTSNRPLPRTARRHS